MKLTENWRLKEIRKSLGFTQKQFADSLRLKQGSYSDIERGKVGISGVLLKFLITKYRVNPLWLYEGTGDKFLNASVAMKNGHTSHPADDCPGCRQMEKIIEAHIQTIETQQEYINSLKSLLEVLRQNGLSEQLK